MYGSLQNALSTLKKRKIIFKGLHSQLKRFYLLSVIYMH